MTTKITIEIDPDASKPTIAARDVSLLSGGAPVPSDQLVSTDGVTILGNSGRVPLSVAIPCIAAVRVTAVGVVTVGAGVKSVNHSTTGTYIVTLTNPSVNAVAVVSCHLGVGPPGVTENPDNTITVSTVNQNNVATDEAFHLIVFAA
jgi:hypothetical protein